jgi:pimeloyl-ACP methyl ester carboxylesterase
VLVSSALGPVSVAIHGTGPAVVLLHANPGTGHDFDAVLQTLAEQFTVYVVDWPGYGDSPMPAEPRSVTATAYAAILPEVLDGLGLERAAFVGNSVGGYAAARLAIEQPARVSGLVLANGAGFSPVNPATAGFSRLKGTELLTRALIGRFCKVYLRRRTPVVREMLARDAARRGDRASASVEAAVWRSFASRDSDLRKRAAAIKAPVLLVWGTRDPLLGWTGRAARRSMPQAIWRPLPTGHAPFAEDPEGFLAAAVPFLAGLD